MNKLKCIISAAVIFLNMFQIMPVTAADEQCILSSNAQGDLFEGDGSLISAQAEYKWIDDGSVNSRKVINSDVQCKKMTDGSLEIGSGDVYTHSTNEEQSIAVMFDLKKSYQINQISVWSYSHLYTELGDYIISLSSDGVNYTYAGKGVNDEELAFRYCRTDAVLTSSMGARYIKLVFNKRSGKKNIRIGEIAVLGSEMPKSESVSGTYYYNKSGAFPTGYDFYSNDPENNRLSNGDKEDYISTAEEYVEAVYKFDSNITSLTANIYSLTNTESYMDGAELRVSPDGIHYFHAGYFPNKSSQNTNGQTCTEMYGLAEISAKYAKVIMHKGRDAGGMAVSEIEFFGMEITNSSEAIPFGARVKNYFSAYVDWTNSTYNASKYVLYIEDKPFTVCDSLTPKTIYEPSSDEFKNKFALYTDLEPENTYYIAIAAYSPEGIEQPITQSVEITTPKTLNNDKIGNMFCVNANPCDGGFEINHSGYIKDNYIETLNAITEIEAVQKVRLWMGEEDYLQMLKSRGLGAQLLNYEITEDEINEHNNMRVFNFSSSNEPNLTQNALSIEAYHNRIKNNYEMIKDKNKQNVLYEPSLNGTTGNSEEETSSPNMSPIKWLDSFYKFNSDIKSYFDAFDLHAYCGKSDGNMPQCEFGVPEILEDKIGKVRNVMSEYGDGEKPMVFTEFGWTTYSGGEYSNPISEDMQRDYISRAYLLSAANNIYEMYVYNAQDSGVYNGCGEHHFGLFDWYGNAKKSYYGFYNLANVLKDCRYVEKLGNTKYPEYGYVFYDGSRYITAVWNAKRESKNIGINVGNDTAVKTISADGAMGYLQAENGMVTAEISPTPMMLYTDSIPRIVLHNASDAEQKLLRNIRIAKMADTDMMTEESKKVFKEAEETASSIYLSGNKSNMEEYTGLSDVIENIEYKKKPVILSDNLFSDDDKQKYSDYNMLATGAEYTWDVTGTDDYITAVEDAHDGRQLTDGGLLSTSENDGKIVITDSRADRADLLEGGMAVFEFPKEYIINGVDVWSLCGSADMPVNMSGFDVAVSMNGKDFTTVAEYENHISEQNNSSLKNVCRFAPTRAKYLRIYIKKQIGMRRLGIGETVIFGFEPENQSIEVTNLWYTDNVGSEITAWENGAVKVNATVKNNGSDERNISLYAGDYNGEILKAAGAAQTDVTPGGENTVSAMLTPETGDIRAFVWSDGKALIKPGNIKEDIKLMVSYKSRYLKNECIMYGGEPYMPLKETLDILGISYYENLGRKMVGYEVGGTEYRVAENGRYIYKESGNCIKTPAIVKDGIVYVSYKAVSVTMGVRARWNSNTKTISLTLK